MQQREKNVIRFGIAVIIACVLLLSGLVVSLAVRTQRLASEASASGGGNIAATAFASESTEYAKLVYLDQPINKTERKEKSVRVSAGMNLSEAVSPYMSEIAAHWDAYSGAITGEFTYNLIGFYDETAKEKISDTNNPISGHVYIPLFQMHRNGIPCIERGYWLLSFLDQNLVWNDLASTHNEGDPSTYNLEYGAIPTDMPRDKGNLVADRGMIASNPKPYDRNNLTETWVYCRPADDIVPFAMPYFLPNMIAADYRITYTTPKISVTNNVDEQVLEWETRSDAVYTSGYYNNPKIDPPSGFTQEALGRFTGPACNAWIMESQNYEWLTDSRLFGAEIMVNGKPYVPVGYETNMTRVPNCIEIDDSYNPHVTHFEPSDDLLSTSHNPQESYYLRIIYDIKKFNITFEYMADTSGVYKSDVMLVAIGDLPTAPEIPKFTFLRFVSWNYAFQPAQADMIYRAVYEYIKFKVTYMDFEGHPILVEALDVRDNVTKRAPMIRNDLRFGGWSTKKGGSAISEDYCVTGNLTLYPIVKEYTGNIKIDFKYHPFQTMLRIPDYIVNVFYGWLYKIVPKWDWLISVLDVINNFFRIVTYVGYYALVGTVVFFVGRIVVWAIRSMFKFFRAVKPGRKRNV